MVTWKLVYTKQAEKDAKKLALLGLRDKIEIILNILKEDPFKAPPPFEKSVGDLNGAYSRRINIQHRLVYQVVKKYKTGKVIRMWAHYK